MISNFWIVNKGNVNVITNSVRDGHIGREEAKRKASHWIGGDPDTYTVTPLTDKGDRVHLAVTVSV